MTQSSSAEHWLPPPTELTIRRNEVQVWRASLTQSEAIMAGLWQLLSPDERQRARRYVRAESQQQFVVARGVLRQLLSRYTTLPPAALRLSRNPYGRPFLSSDLNPMQLNFNLSHSGDLVLYAFSYGRAVGIDIEQVRKDIATLAIAENFFSSEEVAALKSVSADLRPVTFFNCWTRKEAYIKALGKGLSYSLQNFSVSLTPQEEAALLKVQGQDCEVARWKMYALEPGTGYVAAVIAEDPPFSLTAWEYICPSKN